MKDVVPIALTKQVGLFNQMRLIGNNISNSETTGYKSTRLIFSPYKVPNSQSAQVDYNIDSLAVIDESNGPIKITDRVLDAAIEGEGYFVVQTPLGMRYTRNGAFKLDQNNILVDANFNPVMGAGGGQIVIPPDWNNIYISEQGEVFADDKFLEALSIVNFANPSLIEALGNGLYNSSAQPQPAQNYQIVQGALENSNVQTVQELTKMIETQRSSGLLSDLMTILNEVSLNTVRTVASMAAKA